MKKTLITAFSTIALTLSFITPTVVSVSAAQTNTTANQSTNNDWSNADHWTPDQISNFLNNSVADSQSLTTSIGSTGDFGLVDNGVSYINQLSPQQQAALQEEINQQLISNPTISREQLTTFANYFVGLSLGEISEADIIRVRSLINLPDSWVANAVNIGLTVAGGFASGVSIKTGIRLLLKKYGVKAATSLIEKTFRKTLVTLMGTAANKLVLTPIISTVVKDILDPGNALASYLDSLDGKKNGYISVL